MAGFDNDIMYADNVDFTGNATVAAQVTANGQLLIGSTVAPNIRVATLTSGDASIVITNGAGTIDLSTAAATPTTFHTNSGDATESGNAITLTGTGSVSTSGSGAIVTIAGSGLTTLTTDSGSATTSSNAISIMTSNGLVASAAGSTVTLSIDTSMVGLSITGDVGGALSPTLGNWNILGGSNGIDTTGTGSTLTLNFDVTETSCVTTLAGDSGTATSSGNSITVAGGEGIDVTASGSTVTVAGEDASAINKGIASFDSGDFTVTSGNVVLNGSGVGQTITGDTGGALSPTAGNWNILGGSNGIDTSGSGSTLTLNFDVTETGCITTVNSDSGSVTATGNAITIAGAGTVATSGSGSTLTITGNGIDTVNTDSGTVTPSSGAITLTGDNGITVTGSGSTATISATGLTGTGSIASSLDFVDDFISTWRDSSNGFIWCLYPYVALNAFPLSAASGFEAGHPGVISCNAASATAGCYFALSYSTTGSYSPFVLGGGILTVEWCAKLPTLSDGTDTYTANIGLAKSNFNPGSITDGVYFKYTHSVNSGNWQVESIKSSTATTNNTSTAADTSWHRFKIIVNAGATSISFYIDDTEVGTAITTNIPTSGITPFAAIKCSAGTNTKAINLDFVSLNYTFTTPR